MKPTSTWFTRFAMIWVPILSPASPMVIPAVSDLAPDPAFGSGGYEIVDFNEGGSNNDRALRVFPASDGGSWLVGFHGTPTLGLSMAIVRLAPNGTPDPAYNGSGMALIPSTFDGILDVARGSGDRLYFVGTHTASGSVDKDIEIDCIEATGAFCADFGNGGIDREPLDLGDSAHHDDIPTRVVYFNGALYVGGATDTGIGLRNMAAFVLKLSATTGDVYPAFGNSSRAGLTVLDFEGMENGFDTLNDLAVYAPTPDTLRIALAGESWLAGTQSMGVVFTLDGSTGQVDYLINQGVFVDSDGGRHGSLDRIIVRHDGGFIAAGYAARISGSTITGVELLLVSYRPDGVRDVRFGSSGLIHEMGASFSNYPFGIAERPDSRDVIVGLNLRDNVEGASTYQGAIQFSASGNAIHAFTILDISGSPLDVEGNDLVLDGSRVLTAGDREWSDDTHDYDMTVARFNALDTIFADRFGGPASD